VQLLHDLIATADVFLTNTRLRSLERMGLDHETLLARHDRLVYALITAHGMDGPARDVPGYEQGAFWAWSGAASRSTPRVRSRVPWRVPRAITSPRSPPSEPSWRASTRVSATGSGNW